MTGTRFCFVSDTHGDQIDPHVASIFWQWLRHWKPTIRVHGGDAMDLRWLRSKASDTEKAEAVEADLNAGLDFLREFKPTHFLNGNHDDRLNKAKESYIGAVRSLGVHIQEEIDHVLRDCRTYPYCKREGVLRLGDTNFIHGFGSGIGSLRRAGLVYGRVVQGHLHCVERTPVERHDDGFAICAGGLCKLTMDYNRAHLGTLRQAHGWVYGVIRPNGKTVIWQAHEQGGAWILPSEMRQWTVKQSSKKP